MCCFFLSLIRLTFFDVTPPHSLLINTGGSEVVHERKCAFIWLWLKKNRAQGCQGRQYVWIKEWLQQHRAGTSTGAVLGLVGVSYFNCFCSFFLYFLLFFFFVTPTHPPQPISSWNKGGVPRAADGLELQGAEERPDQGRLEQEPLSGTAPRVLLLDFKI